LSLANRLLLLAVVERALERAEDDEDEIEDEFDEEKNLKGEK
jgi:hypothetical protein